MSWSECVVDEDYGIFSDFPYDIRKKSNGRYLIESFETNGYPRVMLNNKSTNKHNILMKQFKPHVQSNEKLEIDHINRDKTNYHLSNLRWVTRSENLLNRTGSRNGIVYEYVDDIPDEALVVKDDGKHEFGDLYFFEDVFYKFNGINYRKLHINETKGGLLVVSVKDLNGKNTKIFYSKFKRIYDLI
jgi:hypothetical protein